MPGAIHKYECLIPYYHSALDVACHILKVLEFESCWGEDAFDKNYRHPVPDAKKTLSKKVTVLD